MLKKERRIRQVSVFSCGEFCSLFFGHIISGFKNPDSFVGPPPIFIVKGVLAAAHPAATMPPSSIMEENLKQEEFNTENNDTQSVYNDDYMPEEELQERMADRKERYCSQKQTVVYTEGKKPISKWAAIVVIIFVFLYFIALIVLNTLGVITSLLMFVFSLPLLLIAAIIWLISERKNLKR